MRFLGLALPILLAAIASAQVEVVTSDGIHVVATVREGHLTTYDGAQWRPRFWRGVNAGVTTPGHFPGELSVAREDWARWFPLMKAMNARVLRVYTIQPAGFYQALLEFNRTQSDPLWLLQGIWPPEEELIGDDGAGRNAYDPEITAAFAAEIADAVRSVHGDLARNPRPGHAGGTYTADISPYILGFLVGAEWYPFTVQVTNRVAAGVPPYHGVYFTARPSASPFESWLARILDLVATEEMRYRWQHPLAFVNWTTTDPLAHPAEPNLTEDLVSVDSTHIEPTAAWKAGYFSSYHIYPYYPDFLGIDSAYRQFQDAAGKTNPYAAYLNQLRAYHRDMPLLVTEFGVPSSRGLAHHGPMGWNQGMHTETAQGEIDSEMLRAIYTEGCDGAILFSWQDEWHKFSWNTVDLELPFDRRPLWQNRLTNERFYGVLAMDPAAEGSRVVLDGQPVDWESLQTKSEWRGPAVDLSMVHDEAYVYLMLRKRGGAWDLSRDRIYLGVSTLPGGSPTSGHAPGLVFSQPMQFLLRVEGDDARWLTLSAYDQHTYRWGVQQSIVPVHANYSNPALGLFLPWKLLLNRALVHPETGEQIPFEEIEIGQLRRGSDDRSLPASDTLADWQAQGDTIEFRIPWMLLGFMDPSSHRVWDWPYLANGIRPVFTDAIRIEPRLVTEGREVSNEGIVATYGWAGWELPRYRERLKASYLLIAEAMRQCDVPVAPRVVTNSAAASPAISQSRVRSSQKPGARPQHGGAHTRSDRN